MSNIKHVVISAAGLGSRLGMDTPKCLITIDGKTLIERQLELVRDIPNVRIVVGFKEQDVIKHIGTRWKNVTFVRNPDYAKSTNTRSLELGAAYITDPFIAIDGDLIIKPNSFCDFLGSCAKYDESIIGISEKSTEDAIGVHLNELDRLVKFSRTEEPDFASAKYEWCGIAYFNQINVHSRVRFVYQLLEELTPLRTAIVDCKEIDTPRDLEQATEFCSSFS